MCVCVYICTSFRSSEHYFPRGNRRIVVVAMVSSPSDGARATSRVNFPFVYIVYSYVARFNFNCLAVPVVGLQARFSG